MRFSLLLLAAGLAACSTTDARIRSHQAAFDRLPPASQAKVRAGQVEPGFSREMVEMALGRPDSVYTRSTAGGAAEEVWGYGTHNARPAIGFGFGVATGGPVAVGVGTGVGTGSVYVPDDTRVVFQDGYVTGVEKRQR